MSARKMLALLGQYEGGNDRRGQMGQIVVDRCRDLSVKPDLSADDVKSLLDDCAHSSLCTDFVMIALDAVWKDLSHGKSE